jgi:hypothetical protein
MKQEFIAKKLSDLVAGDIVNVYDSKLTIFLSAIRMSSDELCVKITYLHPNGFTFCFAYSDTEFVSESLKNHFVLR